MKAIQCVEWGPPERLALVDVNLPEPGAQDVRVRVEAAGVNFPDALIVQKKYQVQPPLPFTPGTEVAGTIDAVGSEVKHLKTGDRVAAIVGTGGFAQFVCAPAMLVAPLPDDVASDTAAAFTLTYATSHHEAATAATTRCTAAPQRASRRDGCRVDPRSCRSP